MAWNKSIYCSTNAVQNRGGKIYFFCHLSFQEFDCVRNPVRHIHPDAFRGLLVLQRFKLHTTQLHELPPMQHTGHSLIYLELSHSEQFELNSVQDFSYLRKIEYIILMQNGLQSTPLGLNHIANTALYLDFMFNSIQSITLMAGIKFYKLQFVNLSNNRITHLRPELLIAPNLRLLNLENNHLVSLEEVSHYSWGSLLLYVLSWWLHALNRLLLWCLFPELRTTLSYSANPVALASFLQCRVVIL